MIPPDPNITEPIQQIITAGVVSPGLIFSFSILGLLLLVSALVSGSEAAFFSLTPLEKENIEDSKEKKEKCVNTLLKKPKLLLATILVVNNLVNVGIVILSTHLFNAVSPPSKGSEINHLIIEVGVITLVLLLVGEVIPKIYATKNAIGFSKFMGGSLYLLNKIPPISWIANGLVLGTNFIQKRVGDGKVKISASELEQALALTKEDGDSEDEHKILEGIVRFGATEVSQIMRPRVDVHSIDIEESLDEVLKTILECGHSRIPVYKESFDTVTGILFIKDLLPYLQDKSSLKWQDLIRKPFFVTENKKLMTY